MSIIGVAERNNTLNPSASICSWHGARETAGALFYSQGPVLDEATNTAARMACVITSVKAQNALLEIGKLNNDRKNKSYNFNH